MTMTHPHDLVLSPSDRTEPSASPEEHHISCTAHGNAGLAAGQPGSIFLVQEILENHSMKIR